MTTFAVQMGLYALEVMPLFVMLWAVFFRGWEKIGGLLLCAFLVSFVGDTAMLLLRPANNWPVDYWYVPVQFGMLIAIVAPSRAHRLLALGLFGLIVFGVLGIRLDFPGLTQYPEPMMQAAGCAIVWYFARSHRLRHYRGTLFWYSLPRIVPLLALAWVPVPAPGQAVIGLDVSDSLWTLAYWMNQTCRAVGLILFMQALARPPQPFKLGVIRGGNRTTRGQTPARRDYRADRAVDNGISAAAQR